MKKDFSPLTDRLKILVAAGGCKRCGGKRDDKAFKLCLKCRDYFASFRMNRKKTKTIEAQGRAIDRLEERCERIEKRLSQVYNMGYKAGLRRATKVFSADAIELPQENNFDYSELSQMSHAYPRE